MSAPPPTGQNTDVVPRELLDIDNTAIRGLREDGAIG